MKNINDLIQSLEDPSFRKTAGYKFSLIAAGDWQAAVEWASFNGFSVTVEELIQAAKTNPGFFAECGKKPNLGWNEATIYES